MPKFVIPSADKLISEIRQMHNESRRNTLDMGCELIDEKVASRDRARRRAMEQEWQGRPANKAWCTKRPPIRKSVSRETRTNARAKREESGRFEQITELSQDRQRAYSPHIGEHSCADLSYTNARVRTVPGNDSTAVVHKRSSQYSALPKAFNAVRNGLSHVIGEVVLQLEKRIILHVFPDADRMYYGTLEDIRGVIWSEPNEELRARFTRALDCRIQRLLPLGWDMDYHLDFGNQMMQKYGVGAPPFFYEKRDPLETHAQLARLLAKKLPQTERIGMMTILSCLLSLALEDGRALFLTTTGANFEMTSKKLFQK